MAPSVPSTRRAVFPVVLVALVGGGCCSRGGGQRDHEPVGSLDLVAAAGEARVLEIRSRVGNIKVEPTADPSDPVRIRLEAFYRGGEEVLGRKVQPRDYILEASGERLVARPASLDAADGDQWRMDLEVRAPARLALAMAGGVGNIESSGLAGPIEVDLGVGNITVEGSAIAGAKLDVGTGNVRLRVTGTPPAGDIRCDVGVGKVSIRLPAGSGGNVSLAAGVGGVSLHGVPGITAERDVTSASARGKIGDSPGVIEGKSGVGDVELTIE